MPDKPTEKQIEAARFAYDRVYIELRGTFPEAIEAALTAAFAVEEGEDD